MRRMQDFIIVALGVFFLNKLWRTPDLTPLGHAAAGLLLFSTIVSLTGLLK
jgi:hypothetical protein